MSEILHAMFPEIVLCVMGCVLLLMGTSNKVAMRHATPFLAIAALIIAGLSQLSDVGGSASLGDSWHTVNVFEFARYIKLLSSAVGVLLVLLAWPSNQQGTGGLAMDFGTEAGEFFALMLFSIAGLFMVAGANDIMLLFLGIELASIPTYIMVSISRPLPAAQEAGVKYFFLGALAAAVMLFGLSYLYGTTGTTKLDEMVKIASFKQALLSPWQMLAVVMLICGFAFKMAAVPMHVYAGDVYQGAATPVTAFLSFVPKTAGFVALLKILYAVTGGTWHAPEQVIKLLWILAALTMTVGNILGVAQISNVKRVLAYSSVAHSGYMLAGVTALIGASDQGIQKQALEGVLFYLMAYGLMNIGAFGVLILLPSRDNLPATSAETFPDLTGAGRRHPLLGLAMAVSCFSLIGIPFTVGFFGKLFLIVPTFQAGFNWLGIILVVNAAIACAYYLKIVAVMFLQTESGDSRVAADSSSTPLLPHVHYPLPVLLSVGISMVGVLWLGVVWPATSRMADRAGTAVQMEDLTAQQPKVSSAISP
jgi:NADH-quinone oxidoreductase subunit N